jgi:hypothetical protein
VASYFFDASALVKRYVREAGTAWVRELILRERPRIFISSLSGAEVVSAVMKKARTGELATDERDRVLRAFRDELARGYARIPPESLVIEGAMDLLTVHPLRAYDALQLASAMSLPPLPAGERLVFVTADTALLAVARHLGLSVENPDLHP